MMPNFVQFFKKESFQTFFEHYVIGLFRRIGEHHVFFLAGGLTFSLFICFVPIILIIFSVLGNILEYGSVKQQVDSFLEGVIPYENYAAKVEVILQSRIREVIEKKVMAGYLGALGLIFAASSLFGSMRTVLNIAYQVNESKHLVIGKLRDFGMLLLVLIFMLLSIAVLPALQILKSFARKVETFPFLDKIPIINYLQPGDITTYLISFISFLIVFVVLYILYYLVPYEKRKKRVVIVSAFSTTVLWEIAKQLFGYYIANFPMWGEIYGAYVLLVVIGFWCYYSSAIFIIGAEIGQLYRERLEPAQE